MERGPIKIVHQESETSLKERAKQYHILVFIRLRPVLKSEFEKETAISCREDVLFWSCFKFIGKKLSHRH